jgi:hypothetical protein
MTALSPRQHRLWALLSGRTRITTGDVWAANRLLGAEDPSMWAPKRTTARGDVADFCRLRLLVEHGPTNGRWYEPVGVAS